MTVSLDLQINHIFNTEFSVNSMFISLVFLFEQIISNGLLSSLPILELLLC
jgi:hypothetical protein